MKATRIVRRFNRNAARAVGSGWRNIWRVPRQLFSWRSWASVLRFQQPEWARRIRASARSHRSSVSFAQAVNPVNWVLWSSRFSIRWIITRPYLALVAALPAILAGVIVLGTLTVFKRRDLSSTRTKYQSQLSSALVSGDTELASVVAQRLRFMMPENLDLQYQIAILETEKGNVKTGREMMLGLASKRNHGPAASWMMREMLKSKSEDMQAGVVPDWTDAQRNLMNTVATVALQRLPIRSVSGQNARKLYITFLISIEANQLALEMYRDLSRVDAGVCVRAARLANRAGDRKSMRAFCQQALRELSSKLVNAPTDISLRAELAQAHILLEQFDEGIQILSSGMSVSKEPVLYEMTANAMALKSRMLRESNPVRSILKRATILSQAVSIWPKSGDAYNELVHLLIECGEDGSPKLKQIQLALAEGISPGTMHFVLGTIALQSGELEEAEKHFKLAAEMRGALPGIMNNLAVAYSQLGKLDIALRFANQAIAEWGSNAYKGYVYETRGTIYLKMKKPQEAISDFSLSLTTLREPKLRAAVHRQLMEANTMLGDTEQSELHRERAEFFEKRAEEDEKRREAATDPEEEAELFTPIAIEDSPAEENEGEATGSDDSPAPATDEAAATTGQDG